jgi:hypothetical protein
VHWQSPGRVVDLLAVCLESVSDRCGVVERLFAA